MFAERFTKPAIDADAETRFADWVNAVCEMVVKPNAPARHKVFVSMAVFNEKLFLVVCSKPNEF